MLKVDLYKAYAEVVFSSVVVTYYTVAALDSDQGNNLISQRRQKFLPYAPFFVKRKRYENSILCTIHFA